MSKYSSMINDSVKMQDIVRRYLPREKIVAGRIACPFHNGHDRNLAIYHNCFVCYVCGEKGGAVKFVSQVMGESTNDAEKRINADFDLGLPIDGKRHSLAEQIAAERRLKRFVFQRDMEDLRQENKQRIRLIGIDLWLVLSRLCADAKDEFSQTGEWPVWAGDAFRMLAEIEYEQKGGD